MRTSILAAILCVMLLSTGCGQGTPPELDQPIVFIGIDSADWTWIHPLEEAGEMPNFSRLTREGVTAPLQSLVPLQKSPTIWTTIATGKRPAKHGIADFITSNQRVATSDLRKAASFWEILGALGRTQAVLGWWITHPATPVNGVLVSDFLPYFVQAHREEPSAVYPPELWPEIAAVVVRPDEVGDEILSRFVDLDLIREHGKQGEALIADLRGDIAGDLTYLAIAKELYEPGRFDVFTVYFRGLDMACHSYWKFFEPHKSRLKDDDWRVMACREIVPSYYRFVDRLVGEVLAFTTPDSRVMIASDHGFEGHHRLAGREVSGVKMHRDTGILLISGPGVRKGFELEGAEVKDLMPTLLAMSGVPLARDLDGHLLGEAFTPATGKWFDELLAHSVDSYEGLVQRPGTAAKIDDAANEAMLEQLRSLGYIE